MNGEHGLNGTEHGQNSLAITSRTHTHKQPANVVLSQLLSIAEAHEQHKRPGSHAGRPPNDCHEAVGICFHVLTSFNLQIQYVLN